MCALSYVRLFATPCTTVGCQAPLSMGFSHQEYWCGLHFPLQRIFLTQGLNLCLLAPPALGGRFLTTLPPGKPQGMNRDMGTGSRWQEITHLLNSGGPQADKEMQKPLDWQITSWKQTKKVRKGRNLLHCSVTWWSLCSHYNKISLAEVLILNDAMTLLS